MKLRNRIALNFTILTCSILIIICCAIYFLFDEYVQREFFMRLEERARTSARIKLERDEMNQKALERLRKDHSQTLPNEREYLILLDDVGNNNTLPFYIRTPFYEEEFLKEEVVEFRFADTLGVAVHYFDDNNTYLAVLTAVDQYGRSKLNSLRRILISILLLYFILVFFVGRWYARQMLNPITDIADKMRAINTSNLHLRIEDFRRNNDELGSLVRTFNNMLDRISTSLESQNNFISNASHQLKNPLTAILGEVEVSLRKEHSAAEYRNSLLQIGEEADRLNRLILQLLHLAQTGTSGDGNEFTEVRIDDLLMDIREELRQARPEYQLRIDVSTFPREPEKLIVQGNRHLLQIAFTNIIENAFKFSDNEAEVQLKAEEEGLKVTIKDKGIGIPEAALERIFDPFYRAGNVNHIPGYGVGLPLVRKIIQLHHGRVTVSSQLHNGSTFCVFLPAPHF